MNNWYWPMNGQVEGKMKWPKPKRKPFVIPALHQTHEIKKIPNEGSGPHAGHYRCIICDKFIQWYPKDLAI